MKVKSLSIWLLAGAVIGGAGYYGWLNPPEGDNPSAYLVIKGQKPADAHIVAFAHQADTNPACEQSNWLSGAHFLSSTDNIYEPEYGIDARYYQIKIPLPSAEHNRCQTKLQRVKVFAMNQYETRSFAEVAFSFVQAPESRDLANTPHSLKLQANCEALQGPDGEGELKGVVCDFFHDKSLVRKKEASPLEVALPESLSEPNTVIQYDVIAGKHYFTQSWSDYQFHQPALGS